MGWEAMLGKEETVLDGVQMWRAGMKDWLCNRRL